MPSAKIVKGPVVVELVDEAAALDDLITKATIVVEHLDRPSGVKHSQPAPKNTGWLDLGPEHDSV